MMNNKYSCFLFLGRLSSFKLCPLHRNSHQSVYFPNLVTATEINISHKRFTLVDETSIFITQFCGLFTGIKQNRSMTDLKAPTYDFNISYCWRKVAVVALYFKILAIYHFCHFWSLIHSCFPLFRRRRCCFHCS